MLYQHLHVFIVVVCCVDWEFPHFLLDSVVAYFAFIASIVPNICICSFCGMLHSFKIVCRYSGYVSCFDAKVFFENFL